MSNFGNQPNYESLTYSDEQLDEIYAHLTSEVKQLINRSIEEALSGQLLTNVRPGSRTWVRVQRQVLLSKLCESEDREKDAELGT